MTPLIDILSGLVSVSGDTVSKLPDFTALSSQLAKATPSLTSASAYTVTNTEVRACPATGTAWAAASALPPIANSDLCSCMVDSLSCVANSGLSGNDTATLFSTVCGYNGGSPCDGITANATTGVYGAYSMCTSEQQLSFAFNQYFLAENSASTACDFGGNAKTQSGSSSTNCKALLNQAGASGTGTVTSVPTAASASGSSASGTSSSTATSTKKGAAGALVVPRFDLGMLQMGAYVVIAMGAGMGMVLL